MANKIQAALEGIYSLMRTNQKNELLTFDDAVYMLGFSKSYLYKLTSQRQIPHYKPIGKTIYFKRSELMQWIESSRVLTDEEILTKHQMSKKK